MLFSQFSSYLVNITLYILVYILKSVRLISLICTKIHTNGFRVPKWLKHPSISLNSLDKWEITAIPTIIINSSKGSIGIHFRESPGAFRFLHLFTNTISPTPGQLDIWEIWTALNATIFFTPQAKSGRFVLVECLQCSRYPLCAFVVLIFYSSQ